jgi:DHA1 family bicyclomycin/chloramphenicol resistance-like MFS transporter
MKHKQLSISGAEFIAVMAIMSATAALSIDGMLPALPQIGDALSPKDPNKAQFVLSFFIWGLAIGTFLAGPISDAIGRKITTYLGVILFCSGAYLSYCATNIEMMFAARFLQGIGAAAPRIVAQAMTRDFYSGRDMARITSFIMMIFALVPAFAPLIGSFVIAGFGWRAVFAGFFIFGIINFVWVGLRIPEPLSKDDRIALNFSRLLNALKDMFAIKLVRISVYALITCYSVLFVTLLLVQQAFEQVFQMGGTFVYWFAAASICVGISSIFNSHLVMRYGMRLLTEYATYLLIATSMISLLTEILAPAPTPLHFVVFYVWLMSIFVMIGFSIGNLTALAMEPLGHIAGTAASTINALATFGGVIYATLVGQQFNATLLPMIIGVLMATLLTFAMVWRLRNLERG